MKNFVRRPTIDHKEFFNPPFYATTQVWISLTNKSVPGGKLDT
jgi:hypothetical protein